MMAKEEVVHFVEKWQHTLHEISPSFFEMTVAMAFDYFSKMKVDVAIIETGMGGRLDSTNIIQPELSIITNISLDHTEFLGSTLQDIAFEKAGIIKQNTPCLSGSEFPEVNAVIEAVAAEKKSPLILVEKERKFQFQTYKPGGSASFFYKLPGTDSMTSVETDLTGAYQAGNISIVLSAIGQLNKGNWDLSEEAVQKGLQKVRENTGIRGRWETLGSNPRILCDTAHNEAGIEAIFLQLKQLPYKNLHIVWGMVSDKSLDRILKLLPMEARYYFTQASIPRAMPVNILAGKALEAGLSGGSYLSVERAYAAAQEAADPQDLIFIGGSTFVVADLLESL
jgi:dihydrofolate synthase/folylpolyglutamate synthase